MQTCTWAETVARVVERSCTGTGPCSAAASRTLTTHARLASRKDSSTCVQVYLKITSKVQQLNILPVAFWKCRMRWLSGANGDTLVWAFVMSPVV